MSPSERFSHSETSSSERKSKRHLFQLLFFFSAEENLNRIIRFSTPSNVVRIQYDLFQEIKRNGNDRSLRIALNLFGHYAHMIKQRKVKPYALNLLPCIFSISQRKEQQLIETLSTFLVKFCKYFQISLTENEVSNLIEVCIDLMHAY